MANTIPLLNVFLDPGASGTKVIASVDQGKPICFLMPPHCTEINAAESIGEDFDASSTWIQSEDTYYAVGILAQQNSSKSINVKPLKVESAPVKTLAAIAVASQKLGLSKKIMLSLTIVLPSGESLQRTVYEKELEQLLEKKISSPWGVLQAKLRLFKCNVEGKGILNHHRKETNAVRNTLILMLGYRNASFIATQGKVVASKNCSDIGFHNFLQKLVTLTSGYSIEQLLLPVTRYGIQQKETGLNPVLRFSSDSPHRQQELIDLKAAIEQAEIFYIKQLVNWLEEFLSTEVDEIVLAGGSAGYIGYGLAEKLAGRIVPSEDDIHMYEGENLPKEISQLDQGDRFLDIYGLWREVNSM